MIGDSEQFLLDVAARSTYVALTAAFFVNVEPRYYTVLDGPHLASSVDAPLAVLLLPFFLNPHKR